MRDFTPRLGRAPEEPCWKIRYASAMKAAAALEYIAQEHAASGAFAGRKMEKRFYHCRVCSFWHLTSKGSDHA